MKLIMILANIVLEGLKLVRAIFARRVEKEKEKEITNAVDSHDPNAITTAADNIRNNRQ